MIKSWLRTRKKKENTEVKEIFLHKYSSKIWFKKGIHSLLKRADAGGSDDICKFRSTFVWLSGMFPAFRCNYSWCTTGRSSPARVAAFPGLPSATGRIPFGRLVSSSPALSLRGCGPKALNRSPSVWGCGRFLSRPWWPQWPTKANLHMPYCWRCPLGLCDSYLLLSNPRTWPGVLSGTRLSQAGTIIPCSQPILDRLGYVSRKLTRNPESGRYPTLYPTTPDFRRLTTYRRLYYDFNRSISQLISAQTHW